MNPLYLNVSFAACLLAAVFYAGSLFFKNKSFAFLARLSALAGVIGLPLYIGVRWHIAQRPPLSNMFESLVVFAWAILIAVIITDLKYKIKSVTLCGAFMAVIALGYASLLNKEIVPLLPALKSNWLTIHVLTCFVGYAAFTVSFVASIVYLVQVKFTAQANANVEKLDSLSYNMIAFGFLFLTLGIITGAVWANSAWGTYWSWDPKETWSLISWFVYAIYLHVRHTKGWRGAKAAWLSVLGYLSVLFTYFGVNYLLSGLHSYG